jgi:hypothetical protein
MVTNGVYVGCDVQRTASATDAESPDRRGRLAFDEG